ncbi:hypothetical protein ACET3Z_027892 [Daucus carota]
MNEEKQRLKKKLKETRNRATNVRLGYFHPPLWENVVKYSDNEDHKHRFKVGSQNREKVETLYTSGNDGRIKETHTTKASRKTRDQQGQEIPTFSLYYVRGDGHTG